MNRERARDVLTKLDIAVDRSDADGIWISRTICPGGVLSFKMTEHWRIHTGGGIAGNADKLWISPKVRQLTPLASEAYTPRGPFATKAQLEKALRAWRRGE